MSEFDSTCNRLDEVIRALVLAQDDTAHLTIDEWLLLFRADADEPSLERIGGHVTSCRSCSHLLLEADEYASTVQDRDLLLRTTPRYVPGETSHRLILEAADCRVWVERVQGGWLLAAMDIDVEAVAETIAECAEVLQRAVDERSHEQVVTSITPHGSRRRSYAWLLAHGGAEWADRFSGELASVIEGAEPRIRDLEVHRRAWDTVEPLETGSRLLSEAQLGSLPSTFRIALQLAQTLLDGSENPVGPDTIGRRVRSVVAMLRADGEADEIDEDLLVRELEARYTTGIGTWGILEKYDERHRPWVHDRKAHVDWRFWSRYQRLLREKKAWVPLSLSRLGEITDTILDHLEDPTRQGPFDRRGMVVGEVQSGKTANYIGLICKAADAGYKVIIVMSGLHNNLRSQTQWRIDEGFLGWDTRAGRKFDEQTNQKVGVGKLRGEPWFTAPTLTTNAINGDFNNASARQAGIVPGGNDPILLVVKKHRSVLENVRNWALQVLGEGSDGQRRVRGVPLLLIDDEADSASINTAPRPHGTNDYSVTAINGEIRKLLSSFEQSAYVGYTATPFANIFIDPDSETASHGADIFPEHFILNVPAPSNYTGPARVFGLAPDSGVGNDRVEQIPVIRTVDDHTDAFPALHDKYHRPDLLPESLRQAIRAFVLACAARRARGQRTDHNSMLVHVTRFVNVQREVEELVRTELTALQNQIAYANRTIGRELLTELEELWQTDFVPTTNEIPDFAGSHVTWPEVRAQLREAASRIQVRSVNSESKVASEYIEHPNGLSVIVVGGNKLSRGLTLEGLSVSYYLRATRMYDTLMQMGRWFGYRPGYLDLCRLYTTDELAAWYRHITLADMELRRDFDHMQEIGATPREYALRVRTHPDGLLVTAINKMRDTVVMRLSYSGRLAESSFLHTSHDTALGNLETTEAFVRGLGAPTRRRDNWVWSGVPCGSVIDYFNRMAPHPHATSAHTGRMAEYISAQTMQGELRDWTVALIHNTRPDPGRGAEPITIGGRTVVRTWRDPADNVSSSVYAIRQGRIVNPPDEYLDFDDDLSAAALTETVARYRIQPGRRKTEPTSPSGEVVRRMRPPNRGLLILYPLLPPESIYGRELKAVVGHAVSFPYSPTDQGVEYRIGETFWRRTLGEDDDDDA